MDKKSLLKEAILFHAADDVSKINRSLSAIGQSLIIHEWKGSGPDYLHVHYADDEAWHVLEGTLTFTFADRTVTASAGTTIFVPAGVAHTYSADNSARYLMILTPRLNELISELHSTAYNTHAAVMKKYQSEILN